MDWAGRIGRRVKLRDLHILLSVTQCGSMAKAARHLSVSHPVISKSIAGLERTLGVRLVERTPHGIEPTESGRVLLRGSIAAFDDLKQSVQEIESFADPSVGEVSIGASEPVAAGLLSAIIAKLVQTHPRLVFHIEQGDAHTLQRHDLRERKVELVIARTIGPNTDPDLQTDVLFREKLLVVAGANSKWSSRRKVALKDLVGESWILSPLETQPGSPVVAAFRATGLTLPKAHVLAYSLPLRASLLATGQFLTVMPESVFRFGAARLSLRVLPVELPRWQAPVAIVTLKRRTLSRAAMLFIETAHRISRPLTKRPS
jgi:DNA-binding transcriptional LysR family regulator